MTDHPTPPLAAEEQMMPDPSLPRPIPYGQEDALDALKGCLVRLRSDRQDAENARDEILCEIEELDRQASAIELVLRILSEGDER